MAGVSPEQLLVRLAKGKPVPGILLLGNESYLREMCRRKISDAYVPEGVRDWGITRYSADDDSISTILSQAQTLPMLAPQQVIFVRDVEAWDRLGDDSRDALVALRVQDIDRRGSAALHAGHQRAVPAHFCVQPAALRRPRQHVAAPEGIPVPICGRIHVLV